MYKNDFKELENEKITLLKEEDIIEINGGGFCDFILDIINSFRK